MADKASRRGAVDFGVILMVVSFAVIGYFMYWLQGQAEAERAASLAAAAELEEQPATTDPAAGATTIVAQDVITGAGPFEGELVRVASTPVASMLGQQGFWLDFPQNPFLVSYSASLLAQNPMVSVGSSVTVVGTVRAMTDSIAASWREAGRIQEGDELAASFTAHFIDAQSVEVVGGGGGGGL